MLAGKRRRTFILFGLFVILSFSCNRTRKINKIPLHKVSRGIYADILHISGEFESSSTYSIICPRLRREVEIKYLIPDGTYVKKGDTVCILESSEFENDYLEALQSVEKSKSDYTKTKANLDLEYLMLEAQVQLIETTSDIKELDSVQMKFATPVQKKIIELELEQAQLEKEKLLNQQKFSKKINESELTKLKLRIRQQENRVQMALQNLDMLVLTSRGDGIALRAVSWRTGEKVKEGDVVSRNFPLITIPDLKRMQVKIQMSEAYYKRTERNQQANIYVDAIPGIKMTGKVKFKEPVGKPINRKSNVKTFGVTISIDSLIGNIKPGMSATCEVIISNIPDTLVVPYVSVFEDDSTKYVYVKHKNKFEKRKIELIINNNNLGVVKSGVKENDIISLIKPPESIIKSTTINEDTDFNNTDSSSAGSMQQ